MSRGFPLFGRLRMHIYSAWIGLKYPAVRQRRRSRKQKRPMAQKGGELCADWPWK